MRYHDTFTRLEKEKKLGFCPFAVLGAPNETECLERVSLYLSHGASMLELGIPFSDPVADGPTIAAAVKEALGNGITTEKCFKLLKKIRSKTEVPIGLLCYANSIFAFGTEKFFSLCNDAGVDSVLIADCPLEELTPFKKAARSNGVGLVMIVSENTSLERLKQIEKIRPPFLYVVSSLGVTGVRKELPPQLFKTLSFLKKNSSVPCAVGFGISKKEHFDELKDKTNAVIVGSFLQAAPLRSLCERLHDIDKMCYNNSNNLNKKICS